jgi:hypothetical protein
MIAAMSWLFKETLCLSRTFGPTLFIGQSEGTAIHLGKTRRLACLAPKMLFNA